MGGKPAGQGLVGCVESDVRDIVSQVVDLREICSARFQIKEIPWIFAMSSILGMGGAAYITMAGRRIECGPNPKGSVDFVALESSSAASRLEHALRPGHRVAEKSPDHHVIDAAAPRPRSFGAALAQTASNA
jgi:hypothetical protein